MSGEIDEAQEEIEAMNRIRDDDLPVHPQIEPQQKLAWCAIAVLALVLFGAWLAS